jgi:hypothetical protein
MEDAFLGGTTGAPLCGADGVPLGGAVWLSGGTVGTTLDDADGSAAGGLGHVMGAQVAQGAFVVGAKGVDLPWTRGAR